MTENLSGGGWSFAEEPELKVDAPNARLFLIRFRQVRYHESAGPKNHSRNKPVPSVLFYQTKDASRNHDLTGQGHSVLYFFTFKK